MTLSELINRDCSITRRTASGSTDDYGNEVATETTVDTVCELQQRNRSEPDAAGEFSDADWMLILPAGTEITTADTVTVDGQDYEVVGDPWPARNPRTREPSHVEATVRRTAGAFDEGAGS
jgi:hypothetical protein